MWANSKYGASDRPISALAVDRAAGTMVAGTTTGLVAFGKVSDHPSHGLPVLSGSGRSWTKRHEDIVSGATMMNATVLKGDGEGEGTQQEWSSGLVVVTASADRTLTATCF